MLVHLSPVNVLGFRVPRLMQFGIVGSFVLLLILYLIRLQEMELESDRLVSGSDSQMSCSYTSSHCFLSLLW